MFRECNRIKKRYDTLVNMFLEAFQTSQQGGQDGMDVQVIDLFPENIREHLLKSFSQPLCDKATTTDGFGKKSLFFCVGKIFSPLK